MATVGDWTSDDFENLKRGLLVLTDLRIEHGVSVESFWFGSEEMTVRFDDETSQYVVERVE